MDHTVDLGVAHLQVLEPIGRGGFSVVYKAFDSMLDRPVAVKVLTAAMGDAERERFGQECKLHGPLSTHPGIVTIHDAGTTPVGQSYLVMEFVDGGTLHDRLAEGPLPWAEAVDVMIALCAAVGVAHRHGVLHRDIKPANVLLADDGPRLADFGIACVSDATSPQFAVSWHHAPPEAESNRRDERSDIYSLGSTLYTMLTGHPPFWRGNDDSLPALLLRLSSEEVPSIAPELAPAWLDDLVQQATAKDPAQRPPSAAALADALRRGRTATCHLAVVPPVSIETPGTATATVVTGSHTTTIVDPAESEVAGFGLRRVPDLPPKRPARSRVAAVAALAAVAIVAVTVAASPAASLFSSSTPGTGSATGSAVLPDGTASETTESTEATVDVDTSPTPTSSTTETTETPETTTETSETTATTDPSPGGGSGGGGSVVVETVAVPPVAGLASVVAAETLHDAGFTDTSTVAETNNSVAAGVVLRTTPPAGSEVDPSAPITVVVSSGPELVPVPDLVGLTRAQAEATLAEVGLGHTVSFRAVDDETKIGIVLEQTATAPNVAVGTDISFVIGRQVFTNPSLGLGTAPVATIGEQTNVFQP